MDPGSPDHADAAYHLVNSLIEKLVSLHVIGEQHAQEIRNRALERVRAESERRTESRRRSSATKTGGAGGPEVKLNSFNVDTLNGTATFSFYQPRMMPGPISSCNVSVYIGDVGSMSLGEARAEAVTAAEDFLKAVLGSLGTPLP